MTRDDQRVRDFHIRDVPKSCTCLWTELRNPYRWVRAKPNPECIWHNREAA